MPGRQLRMKKNRSGPLLRLFCKNKARIITAATMQMIWLTGCIGLIDSEVLSGLLLKGGQASRLSNGLLFLYWIAGVPPAVFESDVFSKSSSIRRA